MLLQSKKMNLNLRIIDTYFYVHYIILDRLTFWLPIVNTYNRKLERNHLRAEAKP